MGLINWANLPDRDFDFSLINMITGESGAGKTTLLDALQTILTGSTAGLFQYNPGQEEAAQQSRVKEVRTLASYILGCDDASYSRPRGAHGYLIANWVPEPGERSESFAALIGVSAFLDAAGSKRTAKEEELVLSIVRSATLCVNDLLECDDMGQNNVVPVGRLSAHFKLNHPDLKLEIARGKEEYLCLLYGGLRGLNSVSRVEARNAAKALSRFMVYKPMKNLDEFVRTEILDPHDITDALREVSSMMRSINAMEREAVGIENGISRLKAAQKGMAGFIKASIDEKLARYERHDRKTWQLKQKSKTSKRRQAELIETKKILDREKITLTSSKKQAEEQLKLLTAKRLGVPVLQLKDDLAGKLEQAGEEMNTQCETLIRLNQVRSKNLDLAKHLHQRLTRAADVETPESWTDFFKPIERVMAADHLDQLAFGKLLSDKNYSRLSELLDGIAPIDKAHRDLVAEFTSSSQDLNYTYYQHQNQVGRLQERIKRLKEQVAHLENANQVSYPHPIKRALALIKSQCPEAAPCVLCDQVELADQSWQIAVEGLVGDNRFLILVDPAHEAAAIEVMIRHGLNKTAIVQGRKAMADAGKLSLPETSVVHLLRFSHHLAESYFKARYGNVHLLSDGHDPTMTANGLKQNGLVCLNYRVFMPSVFEAELVFGTEARRRALKAQQDQLKEQEKQLEQEQVRLQVYQSLSNTARQLEAVDMAGGITKILEIATVIKALEDRLGSLDLTECDTLNAKIGEVEASLTDITARVEEILLEIGSTKEKIDALSRKNKELEAGQQESRQRLSACRAILERYAAQWPDFYLEQRIDLIHVNRNASQPLLSQDSDNYGARMNQGAIDAELALEAYNRMGLRGTNIDYQHFKELNLVRGAKTENPTICFSLACDLARQIEGALNFLYNDILAKHREKLTAMTGRFNNTFISHVCHTLHNAVRKGKSRLDTFNRKLRNHYFGEEYYRFEYKWIPEFYDYYKFFEEAALMNTDAEPTLFGATTLSKEGQKIFDEICEKLLDDDIDRSIRDLKRISDYRNYRTYDIKKCLPDRALSLKTYGAGSGGQMETPSYVIRSAGLASALRFGEGYSHLRTVMIDESFSKMDETRCKAVLDYLCETLGLQVLFVVPTKSSGVLHDHVDRIILMTKLKLQIPRGELDTGVTVNSYHLKKRKVAELWRRERISIENRAHQMTFLELLENKT
jgi:energy-coupling factor transporter ATP-binding protein EcfA2